MKKQIFKKLSAFIITVMMFFILTESVKAQKISPSKTYNCICGFTRNYGCKNGDAKCHNYCAGFCGIKPIIDTSLIIIDSDHFSQSNTISFLLPSLAMCRDMTEKSIITQYLKMQQTIQQLEFGAIDENGNFVK